MECVKICEYLRHYGSYPRKYVREIYNNLSIIMRTRSANKFINSCTLCGLCGEVCPTDLDMGTVNLEARQSMVNTGKMPVSAHDFALRDMAFSNSERFASTLLPAERETCTHMLFPGCQLAASNPEYVGALYQTLAGVFPEMGVMLRCCGAPAEWSGETELLGNTVNEFRMEWQSAGCPILILSCSSCNSVIKKHMPEVKTISAWEILEQNHLFPKDRASGRSCVIHDPCTSRYEPAWQDAARSGLSVMGMEFHELKMSRSLTECCGYGGLTWLANPEMTKDIIRRRIGEDLADFLTYCVMCRDLFAAEGKPTLHLLDLLYGKDSDSLATRRGPDYSQRHENRIRAKQSMIKLITGKDRFQVETYEKYKVILSQELRDLIESRLILVEDIQKVIEHAETTREFFIDQESGHALASFKPNLITYWVEYSKAGNSYQIHNAYSHRMNIEGGGNI
jgi:Fe-S oxidoreductase